MSTANSHRMSFQHRSWIAASIVAVVMIMLALVGVGLTTANVANAETYWLVLVPLFGFLCIGTAWYRGRDSGVSTRPMIVRQLLHWLGISAAVAVDFFIRRAGAESGESAGLNALLLLAVGCYLAGIHFEWLFAVVGILLTLVLIALTDVDKYLWLIFVIGALLVCALLGGIWLRRKMGAKKEDTPSAIPRA
jgi:general stress protein CsbA